MLSALFPTVKSDDKLTETTPINGKNADHAKHHQLHDYSHASDGLSGVEGRKRRDSINYRRESCSLQVDPTVPRYVQLAASIFALESSDSSVNVMNLPFDWNHNDRISDNQFNATNNLCLWTSLPHSIVSLNLSLCLCKQLNERTWDFLLVWLLVGFLPLVGCLFVELSTVNALRGYEDFNELVESNFCEQDWQLQCGVIGVFLISLLKPCYDICKEVCVGLFSTRCVYDAVALQQLFISSAGPEFGRGKKFIDFGEHSLVVKDVESGWLSFIIFWVALAVEVYVFYLTVIIGMYYTLSQEDASAIVQAAVAISFINEIDNILYEAIASDEVKEVIETCKFEVAHVPKTSSSGFWHFCLSQHQLVLQAPFLIILTCTIVFHLRGKHCE